MDSAELTAQLRNIASQTGRADVLQRIAEAIRVSGNYRWVGLYNVNHAAGTVTNIAYSGPGAPEYPSFPFGKGLTGGAIKEKRTINVGDVSLDPRYLTAFGSTRSEIIVPIFAATGDKVIGTIDVESEQPNAFDAQTQGLLEACAKAIASLWHVAG